MLYKKNPKGEFTPREVDSYRLHVAVSCNPGGASELIRGVNAFGKYDYFRELLVNGQFAHRFEDEVESQVAGPKGSLSGTMLKRLKRAGRVTRTARIDGAFNVEDWDPYGMAGVTENCISSGSYSATPCKRRMSPRDPNFSRWKRSNLPVCREDPLG